MDWREWIVIIPAILLFGPFIFALLVLLLVVMTVAIVIWGIVSVVALFVAFFCGEPIKVKCNSDGG